MVTCWRLHGNILAPIPIKKSNRQYIYYTFIYILEKYSAILWYILLKNCFRISKNIKLSVVAKLC